MHDHPEILFIDDSQTARKLARKILKEKYTVFTCSNGSEGWDALRTKPSIKIVFSDIEMASMNGLQLLKNIRSSSDNRIARMPVVLVTGASDTDATMRAAFELGATDFISKPFKTMDLLSRAYSYITMSNRLDELENNTEIDTLTDLYNLSGMKSRASKYISFAKRHNTPIAFCEIAIRDYHKLVITHGDNTGKQILKIFADRLNKALRHEDLAARVGKSRFAVLLPACSEIKARATISRVQTQLESIIFDCNTGKFGVKLAAGLTSVNSGADYSYDELMIQADSALQAAMTSSSPIRTYMQKSRQIAHQTESPVEKPVEAPAPHMMTDTLIHILEGNFHKIDRDQVSPLIDQLEAFLKFNRSNTVSNEA